MNGTQSRALDCYTCYGRCGPYCYIERGVVSNTVQKLVCPSIQVNMAVNNQSLTLSQKIMIYNQLSSCRGNFEILDLSDPF